MLYLLASLQAVVAPAAEAAAVPARTDWTPVLTALAGLLTAAITWLTFQVRAWNKRREDEEKQRAETATDTRRRAALELTERLMRTEVLALMQRTDLASMRGTDGRLPQDVAERLRFGAIARVRARLGTARLADLEALFGEGQLDEQLDAMCEAAVHEAKSLGVTPTAKPNGVSNGAGTMPASPSTPPTPPVPSTPPEGDPK